MYGGTCLASSPVLKNSYQYMYSNRLKNEIYEEIGIKLWKSAYDVSKSNMEGLTFLYSGRTGNSARTYKQLENLDRIYDIKHLEKDWNGYGSRPISENVILSSEKIINNIVEQPKVYPTGRATIQMQYELEDRSYLEFEVFEDKIVCMKVPKRIYAEASVKIIKEVNMDIINAIVKEFYGR